MDPSIGVAFTRIVRSETKIGVRWTVKRAYPCVALAIFFAGMEKKVHVHV